MSPTRFLSLLAPLLLARAAHAQVTWESCGSLVAHPTCGTLFQVDSGSLIRLANYGSFPVGSRVHVVGSLQTCQTTCPIPTCLTGNTIDPCAPCNCTPYCFAVSPLVACPCGGGHGCANSAYFSGAQLVVVGGTSLSDDDTLLLPWRMPASSTAVYFQGTTSTEVPFGDGKLCVSGSRVRLATRLNVGGQSQYPRLGEPRLSVVGQVASPGPRSYQVWYRDPAPFCTPAQFNLTDAVEILWAP